MIIGIHGKARSGKDSTYDFIKTWADREARHARRDAFADKLKISALRSLGFQGTDAECVGMGNQIKNPGWEIIVREPSLAEHVISGREFLQYYGDEGHRKLFGQDFWIRQILDNYNPSELLVLTDVRYVNEAEALRALDGKIWHVVRPFHCHIAESNHNSEQCLPAHLIDRTIVNNKDFDHLQEIVEEALYEDAHK